jgi:hypothetical protein
MQNKLILYLQDVRIGWNQIQTLIVITAEIFPRNGSKGKIVLGILRCPNITEIKARRRRKELG